MGVGVYWGWVRPVFVAILGVIWEKQPNNNKKILIYVIIVGTLSTKTKIWFLVKPGYEVKFSGMRPLLHRVGGVCVWPPSTLSKVEEVVYWQAVHLFMSSQRNVALGHSSERTASLLPS